MMLSREEVFEAWAPPGGAWSDWAKPIAFAHLADDPAPAPEPPASVLPDLSWVPPASQNVALVLDLPGELEVWCGLALAEARGYRPVPLYNAAPGPAPAAAPPPAAGPPPGPAPAAATAPPGPPVPVGAVVEVWPVLSALDAAAPRMQALALPPDAPPAFLLDANRRGGGVEPLDGQFDNRSVSFTTDFPSGNLLAHRGIRRAIVLQQWGTNPQADLSHTLRLWQDAGIAIEVKSLESAGPPVPVTIAPTSRLAELWNRFLVTLRLRRNPLGGFGGVMPEPSSG
jgi:hypothetical protein